MVQMSVLGFFFPVATVSPSVPKAVLVAISIPLSAAFFTISGLGSLSTWFSLEVFLR